MKINDEALPRGFRNIQVFVFVKKTSSIIPQNNPMSQAVFRNYLYGAMKKKLYVLNLALFWAKKSWLRTSPRTALAAGRVFSLSC